MFYYGIDRYIMPRWAGAEVVERGLRVLLVEAHPLHATALATIVEGQTDLALCATARSGWSPTSNSNTSRREVFARSLAECTFIPGEGARMHEAASTRSPSTSTMQARQLLSAR